MQSSQPGVSVKGHSASLCPFILIPLFLALSLSVAAADPSVARTPSNDEPPATLAEGAELVEANCSACHSLALVAQNRMSRDNWRETIRWMQQKQGLWELGDAEPIILDYLEHEYGVVEVPWRRKPLE